MNAPHPVLHRPFVLRICHGFESLPRRAQLREALEALRRTHAVDFRFATAPELGDDESDISHAHCVALDACIPPEALATQLAAIAADGRPLVLVGDAAHPVARRACAQGCAVAVPADAPEVLADAVRALVDDPMRTSLMGLRARNLINKRGPR